MKFGGVRERLRKIRNSSEYKQWRDNVLKRDNYKCVLCGSKKNIEVDHIKPLALFPDLALDINNGRVLCEKCHKKTDTYGFLSIYKGKYPIHPVLRGDLLYKINALPTSITINEKEIGLSLKYKVDKKLWEFGYRFARIKLTKEGKDINEVVDDLIDELRNSVYYSRAPEKLKKFGITK